MQIVKSAGATLRLRSGQAGLFRTEQYGFYIRFANDQPFHVLYAKSPGLCSPLPLATLVAGATGIEPATYGFGDRRSTS